MQQKVPTFFFFYFFLFLLILFSNPLNPVFLLAGFLTHIPSGIPNMLGLCLGEQGPLLARSTATFGANCSEFCDGRGGFLVAQCVRPYLEWQNRVM